MVEHFAVERQLQVQFTVREGKALANHRAGLFSADRHRGVLNLADSHGDGGALVLLVVFIVANEGQEIVDNTDRAFRFFSTILQDDRCWSCGRKLEGESVSRGAQLLQQTLL